MNALCVLVVEDEPLIRDLLVAALCDAGYRVMAVADARAAEEAFRDYRIDVVFVDIRRPGADEGRILAERLRECPVVYAAASPPPDAMPLAQILRRPFSMRDALEAIARACSGAAGAARPLGAAPAAPSEHAWAPGCGPAGQEHLVL